MRPRKSLKDLLLIHELAFILLVALAGTAGGIGIQMWDRASHESQRINLLIQEIQQTRGDLYRQMKELFDAFFLKDADAEDEYDAYTVSIRNHFNNLTELAVGQEELDAVNELKASYLAFVMETSSIFHNQQKLSKEALQQSLNTGLESGVFNRYEAISARAEKLLTLKQQELKQKLDEAKQRSILVLSIPIALATLLFLFSRIFLKRAIVKPINRILHATNEISAGRLEHTVPEEGAAELLTLSSAINHMARELARSQDALVRTEKQAALGLLVPMLAHNIRNPLASIRATAQVADSTEQDEDTREALQGIMRSVDGLERWTSSLLAYLHPLKPQPSQTSLRHIIDGALVPLQQKLLEKSIQLELPAWEKHDDHMLTDESLLEQALYNLLLNAIEAIPNYSKLEVHADIAPESVRIMIADRGPGMPFTPDPHAISPGPTTKRFGTGLGIPFAFKVCESLSGSISFSAREGGGTLIELELPRFHQTE
ncbi:histidine kinase [Methylovorus sp. MM2]|uniref:sensor histidine kinase n=1 Tax=Methylovorus sp. MM2 TaxID=1848038 RepID=UPI0007E1CD1C|nr:HAMP domain-containing sensor histidine kinase [Methylovorus sp. MM2]OAM52289.1 histidine kinase [Methylovorus sp. MM2]